MAQEARPRAALVFWVGAEGYIGDNGKEHGNYYMVCVLSRDTYTGSWLSGVQFVLSKTRELAEIDDFYQSSSEPVQRPQQPSGIVDPLLFTFF